MKKLLEIRSGIVSAYLSDVFQHAGMKAFMSIAVLITLGLTEGVGLLMLIPFLQLIGIGDSAPSGVTALIGNVWKGAGLPMTLPAVLGVYAVIVTLYALTQRFSTLLNSRIAHSYTRKIRNKLFSELARMEWLHFTKIKTSDINHVLTANLNTIDNGTYSVFLLISTIFVVAVNIGVAFTLSAPMTLVALGSSAGLLLVLKPLNKQSYNMGEEWRSTMGALFGVLMEHLGAMKLAKSFGAESKHIDNFCSLSRQLEGQANRFAGILAATQMFYDIGAVVILGLFFYVAVGVLELPAAKLLIMIFLFARLVPQFSWIQRTWQNILNMLPAYKAVMDLSYVFSEGREDVRDSQQTKVELKSDIKFQDVKFQYDKTEKRPILNQLNLTISAGRTTVIVGPSGGGKSTLADMIMGLLKPDSGSVLLDGKPLDGDTIQAWRESSAYVPQESLLFHNTIRENLLWAKPDASEEEIWEALRLASADEFIAKAPEGLDTMVGDRGVRMSGGERQRLALARALLRKPTLLLLDEATSQLDKENERRIIDALEALRGRMTVVFISHRMSAAKCADRVVVIDRGRVVEEGEVEALARNRNSRFYEMSGSMSRSAA